MNYMGQKDYKNMRDSVFSGGEEVIKSYGEREFAKMYEKELEFYRTVEQLKENFINKYGFSFKNVISQIDQHNKGDAGFNQ